MARCVRRRGSHLVRDDRRCRAGRPVVRQIWSLHFAGMASAPLDIAHFHHDNNHVLNTVYLFLVRTQPLLYVDSLLAVVCGVLSVLVAGWIVREWGRIEALSAMLLTGIAYPRLCPGNVLRAAVVRDHPPHTES